jgi:N-formylglutamate amidohydrolase
MTATGPTFGGDADRSFTVHPGDALSTVLLHVPHASTVIPSWVRERILLDDRALARELAAMTDARTDGIAEVAADAAQLRPWRFVNRLSRLVIDPERFTEPGAEEMEAVGMGAVYTATHDRRTLRRDDPEHHDELLSRFFEPYAGALADVVDERLTTTGSAVVIDVHSYPEVALPYELHPDLDRSQICLGVDSAHTPEWLVTAAREAFAGWATAVNAPFAGTYVPTRHFARDFRVASIMIEIRRDLYLDGHGQPEASAMADLGTALSTLVDRSSVR